MFVLRRCSHELSGVLTKSPQEHSSCVLRLQKCNHMLGFVLVQSMVWVVSKVP